MTVEKMIEQLSKQDPKAEVKVAVVRHITTSGMGKDTQRLMAGEDAAYELMVVDVDRSLEDGDQVVYIQPDNIFD